jgi:hypothetical protein
MKSCDCQPWQEGYKMFDTIRVVSERAGFIVPWKFCPWCGKPLKEDKQAEEIQKIYRRERGGLRKG